MAALKVAVAGVAIILLGMTLHSATLATGGAVVLIVAGGMADWRAAAAKARLVTKFDDERQPRRKPPADKSGE